MYHAQWPIVLRAAVRSAKNRSAYFDEVISKLGGFAFWDHSVFPCSPGRRELRTVIILLRVIVRFSSSEDDNIVFVFVTVTASSNVRCPRNASNVFADDWAAEQCIQHEQHLSAGGFYELFLQHPSAERFDMLCR